MPDASVNVVYSDKTFQEAIYDIDRKIKIAVNEEVVAGTQRLAQYDNKWQQKLLTKQAVSDAAHAGKPRDARSAFDVIGSLITAQKKVGLPDEEVKEMSE